MRTGRPAMLLAATAVLAVTAGCSSGTGSADGSAAGATTGATASSTAAAGGGASPAASPGLDTPQDAVTGIIQSELAGHWTQACSYMAPSLQSACNGVKLSTKMTGKATVEGVLISGKLALVKVVGKVCASGNTECQSNSNPDEGLPAGSETFKQAYDKGMRNNAFSPVPCIEVNGKWYVNGPPA